MTNLTQYEKGCSPSAIQRKYSLTYEQGYELAERLKKTQELELENTKLKGLLKEANNWLKAFYAYEQSDFVREQVNQCLSKINQVLGKE